MSKSLTKPAKTRKQPEAVQPTCFVVGVPRSPFRLEASAAAGPPTVVKDLLRVGNWNIQGKPWRVDRETLQSVRDNFARFKANGNRVPLIWEHDGGAESRSGDLSELFIDGDTLYGKFAITDAKHQASFGSVTGDETAHEVSVEVYENFTDGDGNNYAPCLTHVAIVINPVVNHQGPFKRLSARGKIQMAKDTGAVDGEVADTFTIDEVKQMLADAGFAIPDIASTKESVQAAFMAMVGGSGGSEPTETPDVAAMETTPVPAMSMSLRGKTIDHYRKQLSVRIAAETENAKTAFVSAVDGLVTANKIQPALKDGLIAAGETAKWQLSILKPFESLPTAVKTQAPTKGMQLSATTPGGEDAAKVKAELARLFVGTPKRVPQTA